MKVSCLILSVFLLLGCKGRVYLDQLVERNHLYYNNTSNELFSGEAVTLDDRSILSSKYNFKGGMPMGKWETYEGDMRILQSGTFEQVTDVGSLKQLVPSIDRISICKFLEDTFRVVDIYVICNKSDSSKFTENKIQILNWLVRAKHLIPNDTSFIDLYSTFEGEF